MSTYRGGEPYRHGSGRRPSRDYSPRSRDSQDFNRDLDNRNRDRDRDRDRPRRRDQDGDQGRERDRPVSQKAKLPPSAPAKPSRPSISTSPTLIRKSPTLPSASLKPATGKSPSVVSSPAFANTRSALDSTAAGFQPANTSSSTSITKKDQSFADGNLDQYLDKFAEIVTGRAQMRSDFENIGRILVKRRSEYQKTRERVPDAPSALDSLRGGMERAEKEYKAMEKSCQEHGDRQRQELVELFSHIAPALAAYLPKAQGTSTEDLCARLATLERKMQDYETQGRQVEDQMSKQKISIEQREASLTSSQQAFVEKMEEHRQAFEKRVEEKLESQRKESENLIQALRQELHRLGEDRITMKADLAKLEKALQESQKPTAAASKMAADVQEAIAGCQKDAQKATAESQKAVAESQIATVESRKAMREAQKPREDSMLQPVKNDIKKLKSGLLAIASRLDELDNQNKKSPDQLAEMQRALPKPYEEKLKTLSSLIEEQGRRLNDVDPEQFDKLFWDIDQIRSRLDALEAPVKQFTGRDPAELASTDKSSNDKALEVASEALKVANTVAKRVEEVVVSVKESSMKMVGTFGKLLEGCEKRVEAVESKQAGQKSPSDLSEMQEKLEQVSVKQEELSSTITETAGNTANLSARMEAQDQMHRNLQSQYQNLTTRDLHDAIVGYVSRSYQDEFAEIRKDQNSIRNDQAEMKKVIAEIKTSLRVLQNPNDGRDPKRRRIDADVSLRTNGTY